MAWDTGTITSATPCAALSTKIKNLFGGSGVANWSFVENIPAGTGTGQSGSTGYSIDVYKCAGTGTDANDSGTDFYVAFRIQVPDGAVTTVVNVFEDYEGGTNKRFRRPCATSSGAAPTGSGSWRTDTYAVAASVTGVFTANVPNNVTFVTTGFSYWIKLTKNGLQVAYRIGLTEESFGVHLMDSFVAAAVATDGCPLALVKGGQAAFSRMPGVTDASNTKWLGSTGAWTPLVGSNANANDNDFWQSNKIYVSRLYALMTTSGSLARLIGGFRGLFKSDFLTINAGGTITLGDTMVIDGNTWTVIDNSAGNNTWNRVVVTRPI